MVYFLTLQLYCYLRLFLMGKYASNFKMNKHTKLLILWNLKYLLGQSSYFKPEAFKTLKFGSLNAPTCGP